MYKNNLFGLLQSLDRKEMTRFREFADSPYFNKHEKVKLLVQHLSALYPDFNERQCDRKKLFPIVFVKKEYDQGQLAIIFTYTRRLFDQFLVLEKQQQNDLFQQVSLLQQLREKEQYDIYGKQLRNTQRWLTQNPLQDADFQYAMYRIARETNQYYEQLREYISDNSLQQKQNYLDRFYLSEKLRDACEILVRKSTLQVNYSSRLLDILLEEVESNWSYYQHIASVAVYYEIYQLLQKKTLAAYHRTLATVAENVVYFRRIEQQSAYQYLQNFCGTQINQGNTEFTRHIFNLLLIQLEKGLLFEHDYLPEWHYKNIVTVGLRLGEKKWVKTFIEDYKQHLHPDHQEHAYAFNLASFHYYHQQYDQVLQLLLYLDISDVRYAISTKAILLCTYFELEETEALLTLSDSFQQYLKRQKTVSKEYRQGVENLVKFTRKLALLQSKMAYEEKDKMKAALEKLRTTIFEHSNIFNKSWLMEKLEKLD